MKIAYLFSRYPVPSQTFCDTEIRTLEAAGHEIEIYSCSAPTTSFRHGPLNDWPRAEVLYAPPAPVLEEWFRAAVADGTWPGAMVAEHAARFGSRYDPARRARHALYFADRLRRRSVEHLHVHFANRATHAALFIHALTGVPFSFTAHAQDFLVDLGSDDLLRLFCERAAFVVAVSDWSRDALVKRCPDAAGKIHRIHNGLELVRWPPPAASQPNPAPLGQPLRIFSIGRLIEFKGFHDLLAACRLLRERGVRFSCEIAGEGPWREPLEQLAAEFTGLEAQVRLLGLLSQEKVRTRLEECDVFALACCIDGKGACDVLPTVILEAMAAGKPVVSTRLAAVPEMVRDGVTGLLSPPGDPAALASSLAVLAASPGTRSRQGQAGREKLAAEFSAESAARALAALFIQARAGSAFVPIRFEPAARVADIFCLLDRWPTAGDSLGTSAGLPMPVQTRHLALRPGVFREEISLEPEKLRACDFLPDDLVLETYWRQPSPTIHRLESWRAEVGGSLAAEAYLLAARRAFYLAHWLPGKVKEGGHLHAVGPQAVVCAWLLRRLGAVGSASLLLPEGTIGGEGEMAGSTLRKLAPIFVGGWVVDERKLTASLGPAFRHVAPDVNARSLELMRWV